MKKSSFILLCMLLSLQHVYSQTFHAIIFANTQNSGIGQSVEEDLYRMKIEFKSMANFIGYNFTPYEYKDGNFNRQNLEKVLNNIKCGSDDIVFFYYSGHGGRSINEKTDFPQMQLSIGAGQDSDLYPIYNVKERLKEKGSRLTIVMGDLCNSEADWVSPKLLEIDKSPTTKSDGKTQFYKDLFFKMKGDIIAVSSKPKEPSRAYADGGAFTTIFLSALQVMVRDKDKADWNELLEMTQYYTNELVQNRSNGRLQQHPIFKINATSSGTAPNVISNNQPTGNLEESLTSICNFEVDKKNRIKRISPTLSKFFADTNTKVQVVGRDGKTIVNTTTIGRYLNYLSIAASMVQVMVLDEKKNEQGKVTYLKVHEMHKK